MKRLIYICVCLMAFQRGYTQTLETYIKEALQNSPTIQKFDLKHQIAVEKIQEVKTIPNTEFGFGYFVNKPETRVGAQDFKVSIKQMFPWFGSITSREKYASALSDAVYEDLAIAQRKLIVSVSQSYYHMYTLHAKDKIIDENLELLSVYENMALASLSSGKASAVQVLRIQIKENELRELKQILQEQYNAEKATFNKLLNKNADEEVLLADEILIAAINQSLDSLHLHPELIKYDKLYTSVEKSELLNKKEKAPMLGLGLNYIAVSERPNMTLADNGKDILMPMVSLSIPIFNHKYRSKTKQHDLKQKEIIAEKQERYNILETMLKKSIHQLSAAKISYDIQTENIAKTKSAESILIKKYETENIDFYEVLEVQQLQLKFQMNQIEALKKYLIAVTVVNYLSN